MQLSLPALMSARGLAPHPHLVCGDLDRQEPYSLAMILKEMGSALAGWRIEILASDISSEVLEKARAGIYSQLRCSAA